MPQPIPIRGLSEKGIVKDAAPYDLEPNAWSSGSNVRFTRRKARRSPIYRRVATAIPSPQWVAGYRPSTGFDQVLVCQDDGSLALVVNGTPTDVTPTARTTASATTPWTTCLLGDVLYANRPSHVPAGFVPAATEFDVLPDWPSDYRCAALRSFKDVLVALDITKGSTRHPSMVKWSDVTLTGQMPASWDPTDLATLSNEVEVAQLDSAWIDACTQGDRLTLYSQTQVWSMDYTGDTSDAGQNLFILRQLPVNGGVISQNCVVDVDGVHYVFGTTDIYRHDGTQAASISDGAVREWVYRSLDNRLTERFFAAHLPKYTEIVFGFVSRDADAYFTSPTRCNRAAVFNYSTGTWSLLDLPNVCGVALANVDPTLVWTDAAASWATLGGSWKDLRDGYEDHVVFGASSLTGGISDHMLLGYDPMDQGSLNFPLETTAVAPALLERTGIDLDEVGAPLRGWKNISSIIPQIWVARNLPVQIRVGSSQTPSGPVTWDPAMSFNPRTGYKVDTRTGGRYLALRVRVPQIVDFEVTGFDVEVLGGGDR